MPRLLALEPAGGAGYCRPFLDFFRSERVLCLHFPQLLSSPELRPALSDADHARLDPMPDSGGDLIRNHFFDYAQEKDFGIDGNVARHRGNGFGWIERADQSVLCTMGPPLAWTGFCLICF